MYEEFEKEAKLIVTGKVKRSREKDGYYAGHTEFTIEDLTVWADVAGTEVDITEKVPSEEKQKLRTEFIQYLVKEEIKEAEERGA